MYRPIAPLVDVALRIDSVDVIPTEPGQGPADGCNGAGIPSHIKINDRSAAEMDVRCETMLSV